MTRAWISQFSSLICSRTRLNGVNRRDSMLLCQWLHRSISTASSSPGAILFESFVARFECDVRRYRLLDKLLPRSVHLSTLVSCSPARQPIMSDYHNIPLNKRYSGDRGSVSIELKTEDDMIRFNLGDQGSKEESSRKAQKIAKMNKISRKKKLNELRFYRLKAKKKMNSPNPEVRIRYKLEKAKRKEAWLIEKLRKYEVSKAPPETCDPEILTEEEKFYLKRTGEKKKNYVLVGRRGVFGGVVLNMHLHWKKHETVKVICKPCKPGQVHQYAEELARLSKGIVIDIKPNNTMIFYRGKNYVRPDIMSPPDTLSKAKALEKYRYEQSLEHTSQFIEKLENELQEYHEHLARYKKERNHN